MKMIVWLTIASIATCLTARGELTIPAATLSGSGTNYTIGACTIAAIDITIKAPLSLEVDSYAGTLGMSHKWFAVTNGMAIDETIGARAPTFFTFGSQGSLLMSPQPFILGFWLQYMEAPIDPALEYIFGWAEFTYAGNVLTLVDSAAENTGVGIIAGEYQVIPEPATALLFGIGGFGAWLLRKNKSDRTHI